MEKMASHLDHAMKRYQDMVGVRTRTVDKKLDKIDELRAEGETPVLAAPTTSRDAAR